MDKITCSYCGEEFPAELKKCPGCGERHTAGKDSASAKDADAVFMAGLGDYDNDDDWSEERPAPRKRATPPPDDGKIPYWLKILTLIVAGIAVIVAAVFVMLTLNIFSFGSGGSGIQASPNLSEPTEVSPDLPDASEPLTSPGGLLTPSPSLSPSPAPSPEPSPEVLCDSISINRTDISFDTRGDTFTCVAMVEPFTLSDHITWESSNAKVAKVDNKGLITAVSGGTAYITASCGDQKASCIVRCNFVVDGEVVSMNLEDITLFSPGETAQLKITEELTAVEKAAIVWASSNEEVATVDSNGLVTALSNGRADVTARTGELIATCIVRVNIPSANVGEGSVTLNYSDVTLFNVGEYVQLKLVSDASIDSSSLQWFSRDNSIATVDSTGLVKAVANGKTDVYTTIGGQTISCIIRVNIS